MINLKELTIKNTITHLRNKEFSAEELTKSYIQAIEKKNPEMNAYILVTKDIAVQQAKIADQKISSGDMRLIEGIPIAVKDLFCTKNVRTTACSKILEDFIPTYESTVTTNMFNNGAIMLGKTNMDEFAMGSSNMTSYFGAVKGPWKNQSGEYVVPGGSSGGSAAAVADSLALGALGSDTGGSVRQPASFCGIVGMKPSYGRCSRYGMISFASSLDQAGVLTKTVDDAAILLNSIMSYDIKDSTIASTVNLPDLTSVFNDYDIRKMRIGIPKEYKMPSLGQDVIKLWDQAINFLQKEGAEIQEVSLPNTEHALSVYYIIAPAEASSNLARYDGVRYGLRIEKPTLEEMYEDTRYQGFGDEVKRRIMIGTYVLSSGQYEACFLQAQKVRNLIIADFKKAFSKCDAILTPTCVSDAFGLGKKLTPLEMYMNDVFTIPSSLAGLPCISIPAGLSSDKLPLGLQVIGGIYDELSVLKVAKFLESCFKFNYHPGE